VRARELRNGKRRLIGVRTLALVFGLLLTGAACSSGNGSVRAEGSLHASGGTSSAVLAGYPGIVHATQNGRTIASANTKPDGSFSMSVKPGTYVFVGGWQEQCTAPCNWQAGCGQSAPTAVTKHGATAIDVTCHLK